MPVPIEKLTELTELLVDQMLSEFRKAAAAGESVDPRRLLACQKLLEAASPRDAFKPTEPEVIVKSTGEVLSVDLPTIFKTKAGRDKARKMPYLSAKDKALLAAFNDEDNISATDEDDSRGNR